ncbi:MAG: hypothetical protein ACLP4V_01665 [Methylocella sp.]
MTVVSLAVEAAAAVEAAVVTDAAEVAEVAEVAVAEKELLPALRALSLFASLG